MKMIGNVSDWLSYAGGALIKVADSASSTVPPKDNPELKQTFAQYGVNTPRLDRLGSNVRQRVHCLDATYVKCVLFKNDAIYGGSLGQK